MRVRLETVDAVRDALNQIETPAGEPVPITFPSGRYGQIRVGDNNFSFRVNRWLHRYRVWLDVGDMQRIILTPSTFSYGAAGFFGSPASLEADIRSAERGRDNFIGRIESFQADLVVVRAAFNVPRPVTPLADIEAAVGEWPEGLGVVTGPCDDSNREGMSQWSVPARAIGIGFMPVAFIRRNGDIALTSTVLSLAFANHPTWKDGQNLTAHPHIDGARYCFGTAASAIRSTAQSGQVIATFDLIRRWRVGLNVNDMYGRGWAVRAWSLLASVHGGHMLPLLGWDGSLVQRSDTGEVVPLDTLVDDIGLAAHAGMRNGNNIYLSRDQIANIVGEQDTMPTSCTSCNGPVKRCRCHEQFCVGCHEKPSYCVCSGSSRLIGRQSSDMVLTHMIEMPSDYGSQPCYRCNDRATAVLISQTRRQFAPVPVSDWQPYCDSCARRTSAALSELYADWRETRDRTHEESSTDDANSGARSADS